MKLLAQDDLENHLDIVGKKALGLLHLPRFWTLPFFVAAATQSGSRENRRRHGGPIPFHQGRLEQLIRDISPDGWPLLVRSSSLDEDLASRGTLDSYDCAATGAAVAAAARAVWRDSPHPERVALVVQRRARAYAAGHLSNERRISMSSNRWLCEIDAEASPPRLRSFRVVGGTSREPLMATSEKDLWKRLRVLAAWGTSHAHRIHLEWVWDGQNVWVVQFDEEPPPTESPSLASQSVRPIIPSPKARVLKPFAVASQKWRKVASLHSFARAGLRCPEVMILDGGSLVKAAKHPYADALIDDLRKLGTQPLVVRTSVDASLSESLMLPVTNTVRHWFDALEFITSTAIDLIKKNRLQPASFAFLIHRYIDAPASCWAMASPTSDRVRVDSIWGLPDGLLFYPHDTFEISLREKKIWRRVRCKSLMLRESAESTWIEHPTGRPLDWKPSMTERQLLNVARQAQALARSESRQLMAMFLIGVDKGTGYPDCLPWVELNEGLPERSPSNATATLSHTRFIVRDKDDLEEFSKAQITKTGSLVLRPRPELLRDRSFIYRVAQSAIERDIPIELEGSPLSHAYYLLLNQGAKVVASDPLVVRPRIQQFDKLVRDLVPVTIRSVGEEPQTHIVRAKELEPLLKAKAVEEALELLSAPDEASAFSELGDLLEVIRALVRVSGRKFKDLEREANAKKDARGGFEHGVVLESTRDFSLLDQLHASGVIERQDTQGELDTESPEPSQLPRGGLPKVRWTRTNEAVLPLIPPDPNLMQGDLRFVLRNGKLELVARYGEKDVRVSIEDRARSREEGNQLPLF